MKAAFSNSGKNPQFDNAKLYWQDQYFAELGKGDSISIKTYATHVWNIKDEAGNTLASFSIDHGTGPQQFNI